MRVLVFDLDFTLVDTSVCQDYLKTTAGREAIVEKLYSNEVRTGLYDTKIVSYLNNLMDSYSLKNSNVLPIIVSDSPKSYCEAVLCQHGFNIPNDLVFGAAKKPCVDIECILEKIRSYSKKEPKSFLVIGDSPKDIFFAHEINSPSVWAGWGCIESEYTYPINCCKPTRQVNDLEELSKVIFEYVNSEKGDLDYRKPNFKELWSIESVNLNSFLEHQVEEIGFVKHYVPEAFDIGDSQYISTFFEVHWMVKSAKNVPKVRLINMMLQRFYTNKGDFINSNYVLKRTAGIYKNKFVDWLNEKGVTGKVLLVPAPSSTPAECNKTNTIDLIGQWWSSWIESERHTCNHGFEIVYTGLCVERFKPKLPSHIKSGERFIEDQLSTMGVYKEIIGVFDDVSAVVFLDDVTTSGQTINAMATIFRELEVVPENVPLYGFVWYKTHHPTPDVDFSALILKADKVATDNLL